MLPGESFSCPLCKIHLRKSVTSPQGDIPQSPAGQDDKPCVFLWPSCSVVRGDFCSHPCCTGWDLDWVGNTGISVAPTSLATSWSTLGGANIDQTLIAHVHTRKV